MKNRRKIAWLAGLVLFSLLPHPACSAQIQKDVTPVIAMENALGERTETEISARFGELIFGKKTKPEPKDPKEETPVPVRKLLPGGDVLGVVLRGAGVTVAEVLAEGSSFVKGDRVLTLSGEEITRAEQIAGILEKSDGSPIPVTVRRGAKEITFKVTPIAENGKYRLGISLSDTAAGIGTVTYYDPDTGEFGCLGHAICGGESDEPLPMSGGLTVNALLGGVKRGCSGSAGELRGVLCEEPTGRIECNTVCGVFGHFTGTSLSAFSAREAVEILPKSEVTEGEAVIRSTLKNGMLAEYRVDLYDVDRSSEGTKSFRIRVTDPDLIAITGGIVRGMSGSPILQNGKLVGAVTHVTVSDPTEGYGIFIENMLEASGASDSRTPNAA